MQVRSFSAAFRGSTSSPASPSSPHQPEEQLQTAIASDDIDHPVNDNYDSFHEETITTVDGRDATMNFGSQAQAQAGDELGEVISDEIALDDVASKAGDRVRVSQAWDPKPLPWASLVSVASTKGLLAVAGPDTLKVASTKQVRQKQYIPVRKDGASGDEKYLPIDALNTISVPRLSHVAFSADESCLIIASEQGGGLAVYETDTLARGGKDSAFQISTEGVAIRHLLPNPNKEQGTAHLFGVVLTNGQLVMADLQKRALVDGKNGKVFQRNVTSACWSKKGKQIVVGLGDGTCAQIDPQGEVKAQIPAPPQLASIKDDEYQSAQAMPVTAIHWLETYKFFIIYTPFFGADNTDDMARHDSVYFIAEKNGNAGPFVFSKSSLDPCMVPFSGSDRVPAGHFIQRIGAWDPQVKDMFVVVSSASPDGGVFAQLQNDRNYNLAAPEDENRKILLPMNLTGDDESSAIGMALDFSAEELEPKPIPSNTDDFPQATKPSPCILVVTTDGMLLMWWVVSKSAIQHASIHANMVNKTGPYADYVSLRIVANPADEVALDEIPDAYKTAEDKAAIANGTKQAAPTTPMASSIFGAKPATSESSSSTSVFGKPAAPAFGQSAFGTPSTPAATTAQPAKPAFGQSSFGQSSTPAAPAQGQPAFGMTSTPAATSSWAAQGKATFGATSKIGGGGGFGSVGGMGANKASPWGTPNGAATTSSSPFAKAATQPSGFAAFANKNPMATTAPAPNPFGGTQASTTSPFGSSAQKQPSNPFAGSAFGSNTTNTSFSSSSFGKPSLTPQMSAGSTATLGSTGTGSFGKPSNLGSTPSLSNNSSGLSGFGDFKLGSTFKGDGTAKDDLPMPKNPGAGLFGSDFLGGAENKKENQKPQVKPEPGTEKEVSLKDIPASKPSANDGSGLPPDPSTFNYKKAQAAMAPPPGVMKPPPKPTEPESEASAAPLPPDPSSFNYKKALADMGPTPGAAAQQTEEVKDVPIAGSPPQNVTHSETFSPAGSEAGPTDDGSESWDDEDDEDEDGDEDEEEQGDDEEDADTDNQFDTEPEEESADEEVPQRIDGEAALAGFQASLDAMRASKSAPKSPETSKAKPTSTTPASQDTSYTPKTLPPGPVLQPPGPRQTDDSPRSPSPQRRTHQQRAVTSPVRGTSQIKVQAVPPAKPVAPPAPQQQPTEPTIGDLADEEDAQVKALLAEPIKPTKESPLFYVHTDYAGEIETTGIGGQIERVFRDVNSMIDTVGLNGRSLQCLTQGHEQLKKAGQRNVQDLEDDEAWTLAEMTELSRVMDNIDRQLTNGKLDRVPETLTKLKEEHENATKIRTRTVEMRRQIAQHTDPERLAERDAAPLSAETLHQQSELRTRLQNVQKLLAEAEQKVTMLRAQLSSLQSKDPKSGQAAPVPTVEAVERTILKLTAMVQQKSGDIDLLESKIRNLPGGMGALRLDDDYEEDLAERLGGSKLLTDSPSRRTPPRYPRMAANGDALGVSAMFSVSRFQTPPNVSIRGSPSFRASALGRSTGSLSGSARKKMVDVTDEEIEAFRVRTQRRRDVLSALQTKVEERGATRIVKPA